MNLYHIIGQLGQHEVNVKNHWQILWVHIVLASVIFHSLIVYELSSNTLNMQERRLKTYKALRQISKLWYKQWPDSHGTMKLYIMLIPYLIFKHISQRGLTSYLVGQNIRIVSFFLLETKFRLMLSSVTLKNVLILGWLNILQ